MIAYTYKIKRSILLKKKQVVFKRHNQAVKINMSDIRHVYDEGKNRVHIEADKPYTFPLENQSDVDKLIKKLT